MLILASNQGIGPPLIQSDIWNAASYFYANLSNEARTNTFPRSGEPAVANVSGWNIIRSTSSRASGKWYFEMLASTSLYTLAAIGPAVISGYPGGDWGSGTSLQFSGGAEPWLWYNGWPSGGFGYSSFPYTIGDWVGLAVDLDASLVWARNATQNTAWTGTTANGDPNNPLNGNPVVGTGGVSFVAGTMPCWVIGGGFTLSAAERTIVTLNTAAPGAGTPPAGFDWWGS